MHIATLMVYVHRAATNVTHLEKTIERTSLFTIVSTVVIETVTVPKKFLNDRLGQWTSAYIVHILN